MISALRSAVTSAAASSASLRSVAAVAKRAAAPVAAGTRTFASAAQQQRTPASRSAALNNSSSSSFSRSFSVSAFRAGHGQSDAELAARLAEEIEYERETAAAEAEDGDEAAAAASASSSSAQPEFVQSFLAGAPAWNIVDDAGSDEVVLSREFGNESIRVLYSIGDIDTHAAQGAIDDANAEAESTGARSGSAEDGDAAAAAALEDEYSNIPIRAAITISKPSAGAMTLEALVQDGAWVIENISYYNDAKLATDPTAEADWARRGLYIGPQFDTLDIKVQEQFENYLEERGFDAPLALFIVQYAEYKEQNEYRTWLERVKNFVEA
ncbi:Mitochondrial acidic protein mam33 [Tilletia horrida]|nr:Mitochondrial acidic protein mam33 [Tilletia horrida]